MLARNFKTPAELDITDRQFEGLVKVLNAFERGELKHVIPHQITYRSCVSCNPQYSKAFNMRYWTQWSADCGTVACIGGTACLLMNDHTLFSNVYRGQKAAHEYELYKLFFPPDFDGNNANENYTQTTVEQATHALRTYLQTGKAEWKGTE